MGGAGSEGGPIRGGEAGTTTEAVVAGIPLKLPMVDVHTVSAGGGSIAWADAGGALRVGPRSAGADPGPAAYERGGEEPTVTDANLLLGYLDDGVTLGGEVVLRRDAAERALAAVGAQLGLDPLQTALGIARVADAEMVGALAERFGAAHEQRYGYRVDGEAIELVSLRLITTVEVPKPELREAPAAAAAPPVANRRRANFDGEWVEVDVLARASLGAGSEV